MVGCDGGGWFGLFRVEVARFFVGIGCGVGCLACSLLCGFSYIVLIFVVLPVLCVCVVGGRWFVGRAGGIANALRTRNTRGAHELYESPARKQG